MENNIISVEEFDDYVIVGYIYDKNSYSYKVYSYDEYASLDLNTLFIEGEDSVILSDLEAEEVFLAVDALEDTDKLIIVREDDENFFEECLKALSIDNSNYPELGDFIENVDNNALAIDKRVIQHIAFNIMDFSIYLNQF